MYIQEKIEKYLNRQFASSLNLKQKPTLHYKFIICLFTVELRHTSAERLVWKYIALQISKPEINLERHTHNKPPHQRTVLGRLKTWLTPGYDEISFSPPRSLRRKLQFHLRITFSKTCIPKTKMKRQLERG